MSTTSVSHALPSPELRTFLEHRVVGLRQLRQSLESGDLDGAKQAYQALVRLSKNGPLPNSETFLGNQREQDFEAVGEALKSDDLQGAQQAFVALFQTFHRQPLPAQEKHPDPRQTAGVNVVA